MNKFVTKLSRRLRLGVKEPYIAASMVYDRIAYTEQEQLFRKLRREGTVIRHNKTGTYIRDVLGHKMHLSPKDNGISRDLARDGIREAESVAYLGRILQPDMLIFDLGANIGFYVLLEARIVSKGVGRVVAVEPVPDNCALLRLNIDANGYTNRVTVREAAIADHSGTANMVVSDMSNCHCLERPGMAPEAKARQVAAFTYKDFLASVSVDPLAVDFLRMDIEGAEYLLLPSIYDILRKRDAFSMFIEFHPHVDPQAHRQVVGTLAELGFEAECVTKEYIENGKVTRVHLPNATIQEVQSNPLLTQYGGCEVFLRKRKRAAG